MRCLVLGALCTLALASNANANGRPPVTSTIQFRRGMENVIYAGMSFGLLISKDNGATWQWMCEDALPYGGMYDPDYELMDSGTVFATTFDGLKVNRDGCTFASTVLAPRPPEIRFFSVIARGTDNALYAAASDPKDAKIYKSTDEGLSFPETSMPGQVNDWWQSVLVAPSDPTRLYIAGFRFIQGPSGTTKSFLLATSTDGGLSWTPLPLTDFTTKPNSTLEIAGISRTDPNTVYARVVLEDNSIGDGIYKSTNGGANWTRIFGMQTSIAFVVRANGELVAGTRARGMFLSTNGGTDWTELAGAPHVNCLVENSAGEVWACTQNYGGPGIPMDGFGIMKSADLITWTGVLRYQDIDAPVACPTESLQYTRCDRPTNGNLGWCGLCEQLGCDPKRDCPRNVDAGPDSTPKESGGGCCDSGTSNASVALLGTALGMVLLRRRRSRR